VIHDVQPVPEARGPRHRAGAVGAVRGPGADLEVWPGAPPLGAQPRGNGSDADRLGRLAERNPVRPVADRGALTPAGEIPTFPRSRQRELTAWRPHWGLPGETGSPLPLLSAGTRLRRKTSAGAQSSAQPSGRVGPSGSEAIPPLAGHHYDGAREILPGAVSGDDGRRRSQDAFRNRHRGEGFTSTKEEEPGPPLHKRKVRQAGYAATS
jgi:hypothetical protein